MGIAQLLAAALVLVTVDDMMKFRSIVDVKISPDGERVAYVVSTPNLTRNEHEAALFVVPAGGGAPVRMAETVRIFNTPLPRASLRWLPDSTAVAFLGAAENRPQVFSSTGKQLTTAPEGVSSYEWSPDGKSMAYLTRDPLSPDEARQRSLVTRVDAAERPARLVVQSLDGGTPQTLTPPAHYVDAFSWSPDGRELAYSAAPFSGFTAQYHNRIYAIPAEGGEPRAIVDRAGMNTRPQYSPDGKTIAFITSNRKVDIMAPRSLAVVAARGGEPRLFPMDDAWINEFVWARDSKSICHLPSDGMFASREHMFEQPIVRVWVDGARAERIVGGTTVNYSLSISSDGKRLAYRSVEPRTMGDVFVLDTSTGRSRKLTDVNPELRDLALAELSVVKWRSFDGMDIWGLLLTPRGRKAEERLPLLTYVHGGPGGGVTWGLFPQFMHTVGQVEMYPLEAMVSTGFAVLLPMPRGGAGYGEKGQRAIINAWGEADYRDIMTGIDDLIRRGIADPDRLGIMGGSYGGYMTNWIVTQTNRFKAVSTWAGISDLTDPFYLTDGGDFMANYFKRPWENHESYVAHSPLTFADRVSTPLLIQHGERDPRVPVASAWKFYRALKAHGKTVEFDLYPTGSHVPYAPLMQRDVMRRNLEWFTKRIPALSSSSPDPGSTSVPRRECSDTSSQR